MIIFTSDELGCAYSIDDEGALYYTPRYMNDTINLMDWCEVDLDECDEDVITEIKGIWNELIKANQAVGSFYTSQSVTV